ncbi:hypothetical protein AMTR_s00066p00204410 [Amborella trichopoda]|uniref:Leucine-rich repeat-containing N-terminal plant-type domain-containing protein n=2 Tax=Amborella trichopoda TaxID=13333 RepID=U5D422_AMBTC|nr:hypothetical protein AMTR_s00066p00204410 [Amborella trichopoda]
MPNFALPKTLDSDIEALRSLKNGIDPYSIPPTTFLDTWDFSVDPCENTGSHFVGILCDIPSGNTSQRIVALDLNSMGYDGFLSPSIGSLTELTFLDLSKNRFRGPLPESFTRLTKITTLSLSENIFTGYIPSEITNLRWLQYLDLSKNNFIGTLPPTFVDLRQLTHVDVSYNLFFSNLPDLDALWQLTSLALDHNHFEGGLPRLPSNLRTLSLNNNLLSGRLPPTMRLPHLEALDLSNNQFTGTIGWGLLLLPSIRRINLSFNLFTSIEVFNATNMTTTLEELDASHNRIQMHLPLGLATIESMLSIHLEGNSFVGRIPPEYGARAMNSWRQLFLNDNYLEGSVPSEFKNLQREKLNGSLASNCLVCRNGHYLCEGRQRPSSECHRHG